MQPNSPVILRRVSGRGYLFYLSRCYMILLAKESHFPSTHISSPPLKKKILFREENIIDNIGMRYRHSVQNNYYNNYLSLDYAVGKLNTLQTIVRWYLAERRS